MRRVIGRRAAWVMVTVVLIMAASFMTAMTAVSQSRNQFYADESYYRSLEENLTGRVRTYLNEEGYTNSGIMLNRILDDEGQRTYTITIHHRGIERLSEEEQEALFREIIDLTFEDEKCTFSVKIL